MPLTPAPRLAPIDEICLEGDGPPVRVQGHVRYERLVLGPLGLGPALEVLPARHVDVQIRVANGGPCYGQTTTDDLGAFEIEVRPPVGSALQAWVLSRTRYDASRQITVHNGLPPSRNVHLELDVFFAASEPFSEASEVDLTVPYRRTQRDRPSIGFAILDVLVTCDANLRSADPPDLPACHAYTQVGNNGATGTSLYVPSIRALSLLGGAAGTLDGSDTDYFDDGVIAHEYGHFVESELVHTLSRGGEHGSGHVEPSLAWSEGQATAFGCLCRGDSRFVDTLTTTGGTAFDVDVEDIPQSVRGIGSEQTVAEVVWDLGDGVGGIEDLDGDGVAIPISRLYAAFLSFDPVHDPPYIGLFLDRLVERREIGVGILQGLLLRPEDQSIGYPLSLEDQWPESIAWGHAATGTVDATGLGPCRALEASRWFRLDVDLPLSVSIEFLVAPISGSRVDAEIALLDVGGSVIRKRRVDTSVPETLGPVSLEAGTYIVRVSAGCVPSGTHVSFRLLASGVSQDDAPALGLKTPSEVRTKPRASFGRVEARVIERPGKGRVIIEARWRLEAGVEDAALEIVLPEGAWLLDGERRTALPRAQGSGGRQWLIGYDEAVGALDLVLQLRSPSRRATLETYVRLLADG